MIPLRKFIAIAAVLAVVATACSSSGSQTVATIHDDGDTVITEADLAALYASNTIPVDEQLRSTIFALIARHVLLAGMGDDFGLGLDQQEVDALFDDIVGQMEAQGVNPATFLGIPNAGVEMIRFDAELAVIRTQVIEQLITSEDFFDQVFESPIGITTVCASHILVGSEAEADDIVDRLEAGEDFAAIADAESLDTAPGGDLGCRLASNYVPDFAVATLEAPLGSFFGPVETEFGWHVLTVVERTAPTRAEFEEDPTAFVSSQDTTLLWQDWFNGKLKEADVEVEARYGSWSPVGIVPPQA